MGIRLLPDQLIGLLIRVNKRTKEKGREETARPFSPSSSLVGVGDRHELGTCR